MKDQAGELSAQQAAKLVEDSVKTRDETIAKAEEEYNERLRIAAQLEADGSAESAKLAQKIKEDAKTTRDETIAKAEERHEKIVSEAKAQAGEHVNEVDWETGQVKTKWETAWGSVKTSFENGWTSTKTFFGNMRQNILDFCNSAQKNIDGLKNGVRRKFDDIKTSISDKINAARDAVQRAIEKIKGFFNVRLQFPHIPLPHLSVTGGFSLIPPSVPHFSIDWYKQGAIFTKPTLFNTPYGMKGLGEAGAEAVLPIEKLDGIVANAMIKAGGNNGVTITGNTFNVREEEDIEKIARKLYRLIESKKRGVGLG